MPSRPDHHAKPFSDDAEFLDASFDLLALRVQRLAAERELRESDLRERGERCTVGRTRRVADDDAVRRLAVIKEKEQRERRAMDARLEAHRADPDARQLGLDRLTDADGLSDEEQMVLLSTLVCAVSEQRADDIHGDLASGLFGSQCVEGLLRLLDANNVADRVRLRRIFSPTSPLVKGGLIVLEHYGDQVTPDELLTVRVKLSATAFAILIGEVPNLTVVSR